MWGGQVECRICKWKLLSVFVQLTLFREVGSSFSYIAPTNWVQVNFWPMKALPISHPARQYFMISIVCCSFVRRVNKMLTGILRLIATSYANSTCEKDLICSFFFYLWWGSYNKKKKICTGTFCSNWGM